MNALLIYPEIPENIWAMKHLLKVYGKKSIYPPLGLLTISSLLPVTWNKRLIDLNVSPLNEDCLEWADMVFLSAMNVQEDSVRQVIQKCKQHDLLIVAGGALFTHEFDRFSGIDHFVLNEAEITLPQFLSDYEQGTLKFIYQTKEFSNLHFTPVPDWSLIKSDKYLNAILQYSRGCPYRCDFCDVTALYGRVPRVKKSDQIIAELDLIEKERCFHTVFFADDNLIGNRRILKSELLPALIKWRAINRSRLVFSTQVTINLADDNELMDLMLSAGFRHIFVGLETPDDLTLNECLKKQNVGRNIYSDIQLLHSKGFIVSAGFIVGFDTDTPSIFQRQIAFIQNSGIVLPLINILKAPVGTALFERMHQEGRLTKRFSFREDDTNFKTKMNEQVLRKGFELLITEVYSANGICDRIKRFFADYRPYDTQNVSQVNVQKALVISRIIWRCGVCFRHRRLFWKIIFGGSTKGQLPEIKVYNALMLYQIVSYFNKISDGRIS